MRGRALSLAVLVVLLSCAAPSAQIVRGEVGHDYGPDWCAARIDLSRVVTFAPGTRLCLAVRGGPEFLLRLKPFAEDPNIGAQIVGDVLVVPKNGRIEVTLEKEHRHVNQISVHACRRAWDRDFSRGNGDIRLDAVTVLTGRWACR